MKDGVVASIRDNPPNSLISVTIGTKVGGRIVYKAKDAKDAKDAK